VETDEFGSQAMPTVCEAVRTAFISTAMNRMSRRMSMWIGTTLGEVWLEPVGLARNMGFSPKELRRIQKLVVQHQAELLEAWHGILALAADERVADVKFTKDTLSVAMKDGGQSPCRSCGIRGCSMRPRPNGKTGALQELATASIAGRG